MADKLYVRLKPYNPRRGYVLKRYTYRGARFYEGRWNKVPAAFAQELADLHQRHGDPDSPFAFDVATEKQAREIELAEQQKQAEQMRRVNTASTIAANEIRPRDEAVTTRDLPRATKPAPKSAGDDDRPLGVDMSNSKAELLDAADMLGVQVNEGMSKRQILAAIEASRS